MKDVASKAKAVSWKERHAAIFMWEQEHSRREVQNLGFASSLFFIIQLELDRDVELDTLTCSWWNFHI